MQLRYSTPSRKWTDALPLGNGRLGAMVFGGIGTDRIQFTDETCWSGSPAGAPVPAGGPEILAQARAALLAGDVRAAERQVQRLQGGHTQSFQPLADLWLEQDTGAEATGYQRTLDLATATATHQHGSVEQQVWVSHPAQAMIVRRRGTFPTPLLVRMTSPHPIVSDQGGLLVVRMPSEVSPPHAESPDPIHYDSTPGASVTAIAGLRVIEVSDSEVIVVVSTVTDYVGPDTPLHGDQALLSADLGARLDTLAAELAEPGGYDRLHAAHVADHRELFDRVTLDLGTAPDADTDVRVRRHADGHDDPALAALQFQFGRYLMIASSRPGGLPATLQGIWNEQVQPPWSSNYTTNINVQMNYWPAEVTALPECHRPLLSWLEAVSARGAGVARDLYGLSGWTMHHNSDAWGFALPAGEGDGDPSWSFWPLGAAWLALHLFDHYDFGRDERFLHETAWPLVRQASDFVLDWLVELPDGSLGTAPGTSPEHRYLAADGDVAALAVSPTADVVIIGQLLTAGLRLYEALGARDGDTAGSALARPERTADDVAWSAGSALARPERTADDLAWSARAAEALKRLPDVPIAVDGRLGEWSDPAAVDEDPEHRHTSHLVGVYPGGDVDPTRAAAARKTLDDRGPRATGWALAWRIGLRARLGDAAGAIGMIREFLAPMADDASEEPSISAPAGVYRNLFCAHPPFQIDGNFGFTAGVAEMLVQSHVPGEIHLLPALPESWPEGSVTGLRCRGRVTVGARWRDGILISATLRSATARQIRLRSGAWTTTVDLRPGVTTEVRPSAPR